MPFCVMEVEAFVGAEPVREWLLQPVMVYAKTSKTLIFLSGEGGGQLDEAWSSDPVTNAWTDLRPTGRFPAWRFGESVVYDPLSDDVQKTYPSKERKRWTTKSLPQEAADPSRPKAR
ncbi:MAG: hypothetical protein M5U22_08315 [Thermoleophilia bacterium]|nr:hypothetical protein [Thermoleophilia bacterium]